MNNSVIVRVNRKKNCLTAPKIINIELTTKCPLKCKQCYKENVNDLELEFDKLCNILKEAASLGTKLILFSGGEPLTYPNLEEAIKVAKNLGLEVYISTSGYKMDKNKITRLKNNGLDVIYISLNSYNERINDMSRDGYNLAIEAIRNCINSKINVRINWVARHDNVNDFPSLIDFCKGEGIERIDILKNKADRHGEVESLLSKEDLIFLANIINSQKNYDFIAVESCFCELKNLLNMSITNSILRGCSAGKYSMSIDAEGKYMPCSHTIMKKEQFNSVYDYWNNSRVLDNFRSITFKSEPCISCMYKDTCTPCQAILMQGKGDYLYSWEQCPIYARRE